MTWRVRRQLSAVRFPALAPFWTMAGERRRFDRYRCQCESHVTAATWLPLLLFPLLSGVPIAAGSLVGSLLQLLMLTLLNRYKHRCITSLPSLSLSYLTSSPIISSRSSLSLSRRSIAKASSGSTIKMNRPEEIFRWMRGTRLNPFKKINSGTAS